MTKNNLRSARKKALNDLQRMVFSATASMCGASIFIELNNRTLRLPAGNCLKRIGHRLLGASHPVDFIHRIARLQSFVVNMQIAVFDLRITF